MYVLTPPPFFPLCTVFARGGKTSCTDRYTILWQWSSLLKLNLTITRVNIQICSVSSFTLCLPGMRLWCAPPFYDCLGILCSSLKLCEQGANTAECSKQRRIQRWGELQRQFLSAWIFSLSNTRRLMLWEAKSVLLTVTELVTESQQARYFDSKSFSSCRL